MGDSAVCFEPGDLIIVLVKVRILFVTEDGASRPVKIHGNCQASRRESLPELVSRTVYVEIAQGKSGVDGYGDQYAGK